MRGIRRKALQVTAHALSLTMLFGSFAPAPVYAEAMAAAGSSGGITEVAVDNPAYGRTTVLEVDGKPFWYNGMQVRIDKLREDPDYMVSDETLGKLFQQVADDGCKQSDQMDRCSAESCGSVIRKCLRLWRRRC